MELPVAKESYQPSSEALIRAVKRAAAVYARTVAQEQTLACGTAYTAAHRPGDPQVNMVSDFKPGEGQDDASALQEIDDHFAQSGARCLRLRVAAATWPASAAQQAQARGYRLAPRVVRLLRHYTPPQRSSPGLQIIPARASYAQLHPLFKRMAQDQAITADGWPHTQVDYLDEARLELFLARVAGQAVGIAGVLSLGQMGVLYPAWTEPGQRGKGIGGELLRHVIEHCQRSTFEQVLLDLPADAPAAAWCAKLGFVEVATYADYQRA
jgi:GNAT superfamily N-acetyltransferase